MAAGVLSVAPEVAPTSPTRRSRRWWLAPVLFLLVSLAVFGVVLPSMGHAWIGLDADAQQMVYWLAIVADAVRHAHDPLVTHLIHAPGGVNLMWNTSLLLPGIVLAPLTWIAGPYAAYNTLVIATPVLSATAACVAIRRYVRSGAAAWVGGLVYGFSPPLMAASLGHPHTAIAWYPPVVLLLFDDVLVRRRSPRRAGMLLGAATAAQLLTGEELVLTTALITACAVAVLALQHREAVRQAVRPTLTFLSWTAATGVLIAGVPLAVQFLGPYRPAGLFAPDYIVADGGGLLVPTSRQLLHVPAFTADAWSVVTEDSGAYVGLPLMLLVLAAWRLLRQGSAAVRWAVPVALLTALLALGPHLQLGSVATGIPLPWIVPDNVPLLHNANPARLMVLAWLPLAVVVAAGLDRALRHRGAARRWRCVAIGLAVATLAPALPVTTAAAVPRWFSSPDAARVPPGAVVLVAPVSGVQADLHTLLWQQAAGLRWRMVEGDAYGQGRVILFAPSAITDALAGVETGAPVVADPEALAAMRASLRTLGVDTVVQAGGPHAGLEVALLRLVLGPESLVMGHTHVWHEVAARLGLR